MTAKIDMRLRRNLEAMRIEPEGAAISFAAKLARDNGWDLAFAKGVSAEYRRFLYLAATAEAPVTPSDAVDKAWHLHLTYSRHYWDELCGEILGRPLHHDPSLGGVAEDERHQGQYRATLARYRETFGEEPPAHIWPGGAPAPARRPRVAALAGGAGATMLLAACAAAGSSSGKGSGDINWPVALFIAAAMFILFALLARATFKRGAKGHGRRGGTAAGGCGSSCGSTGSSCGSSDSDSGGGSDGGSSCGGGGCGGGGD